MSSEMPAILPRLAAAANRNTLLIDSDQPVRENPADYYANAITNHYARIVHATTIDGRGYTFPYNDGARPGALMSRARSPIRPRRCSPLRWDTPTEQAFPGQPWASALPRAGWAAWLSLRRI
jgi:hypothetical protein